MSFFYELQIHVIECVKWKFTVWKTDYHYTYIYIYLIYLLCIILNSFSKLTVLGSVWISWKEFKVADLITILLHVVQAPIYVGILFLVGFFFKKVGM